MTWCEYIKWRYIVFWVAISNEWSCNCITSTQYFSSPSSMELWIHTCQRIRRRSENALCRTCVFVFVHSVVRFFFFLLHSISTCFFFHFRTVCSIAEWLHTYMRALTPKNDKLFNAHWGAVFSGNKKKCVSTCSFSLRLRFFWQKEKIVMWTNRFLCFLH